VATRAWPHGASHRWDKTPLHDGKDLVCRHLGWARDSNKWSVRAKHRADGRRLTDFR
jgi:hypothetical protein